MVVSFVGHSIVHSHDELKNLVKEQMRKSVSKEKSVTCLLGGRGEFDMICAAACRELKQEICGIKLVYVSPYLTLAEQARIKEMQQSDLYDESIYPSIEQTPPRFAISKRNEWMMKQADFVIAYVNHDYGGAYKAFKVAKHNRKNVITLCDIIK